MLEPYLDHSGPGKSNWDRVNFDEKETGLLKAGKAADLIVLDRNIFVTPKPAIHRAKVLLTLLDGNEIYWDSTFEFRR